MYNMPLVRPLGEQMLRLEGLKNHASAALDAHARGRLITGLYPYQDLALPKILGKITGDLSQPQALIAQEQGLTSKQQVEAATSFGKSKLFTVLADTCGIGRPAHEGSPDPLRALFVSYRQIGAQQLYEACHKFTPHISASLYAGHKKSLAGDVVSLTYTGLDIMRKKQEAGEPTPLDGHYFDLILCDEAHHRWGIDFKESVDYFARNRIEVAMSGTPRVTPNNKDIPTTFRCSLRSIIALGKASAVQALSFATEYELYRTKRQVPATTEWDGAFSEHELAPLITNDQRNAQIVELIKVFAAQDRMVLTSAVPGQDCYHAKLLAALASEQYIVDPITGKSRKLVIEAVDGNMPRAKLHAILERSRVPFSEGGLDGITTVSLLEEAWDNPNVGALVVARPYEKIGLGQFVGRAMRRGRHEVTIIAELVDRAKNGPRSALLKEILDEPDYYSGQVIGTEEVAQRYNGMSGWKRGKGPSKTQNPQSFWRPPSSRMPIITPQMLSETLTRWQENATDYLEQLIREETYTTTQQGLGAPPEQSIQLARLYELPKVQASGVGINAFRNILEKEGQFECTLADGVTGPLCYVLEQEKVLAFIDQYTFSDVAPAGYINRESLSIKLGISRVTLKNLVKACGDIELETYRCPTSGRKLGHYSPEAVIRIEAALAARNHKKEPPAHLISLVDLAKDMGAEANMIGNYFTSSLGVKLEYYYPNAKATGPLLRYCTLDQAKMARKHYQHEPVPDTAVRFDKLADEFGMSEAEVVYVAKELDLEQLIKKGRVMTYVHNQIPSEEESSQEKPKFVYPYFCDDETANQQLREKLATISRQDAAGAARPIPKPTPADLPEAAYVPTAPDEVLPSSSVKSPTPNPIQRHKKSPESHPFSLILSQLEELSVGCNPDLLPAIIRRAGVVREVRQGQGGVWQGSANAITVIAEHIKQFRPAAPGMYSVTDLALRYSARKLLRRDIEAVAQQCTTADQLEAMRKWRVQQIGNRQVVDIFYNQQLMEYVVDDIETAIAHHNLPQLIGRPLGVASVSQPRRSPAG